MVIVYDAAVGADRDVYASLFEVFVTGFADFDKGCRLAAANAFRFTGDADGTAADTDFDEISATFGEEVEAVPVYDVAGTDFDRIAILLRVLLPAPTI